MQPPSRGCVLKLAKIYQRNGAWRQPPSRGCVLKQDQLFQVCFHEPAAAFARLCVETIEGLTQIREKASSRLRAAVC